MMDGHCYCCGKNYDSLGFAKDLCASCDDPMHECKPESQRASRRVLNTLHRLLDFVDREYSIRRCRHTIVCGECCYCHLSASYIRSRETTQYA
jgi:hypothetical protein